MESPEDTGFIFMGVCAIIGTIGVIITVAMGWA